jgi:hypothetical protein|tara:strand:- start:610 stop:846 length:237 start_codon:yes stop_codon:yes gene_type:complete
VSDNQATPIELAAVLMDAICVPAERDRAALEELTRHLGMEVRTDAVRADAPARLCRRFGRFYDAGAGLWLRYSTTSLL